MKKILFILFNIAFIGAFIFYFKYDRKKENFTKAIAKLYPTKGNNVSGEVLFTQIPEGVAIDAHITGLTPGKHGFHIHEFGDCSTPDASSAGGHFNPTHKKHGGPDDVERHVGDLGNIEADKDGNAHYKRTDTVLTLNGPNSIVRKSLIIHQGEDDLVSQPTGNAGARVACAEIDGII